jgi:flagellar basal-body rod protein FlgB
MCVGNLGEAMFGDEHSKILARLMDVSLVRAQVHTSNIANQDTPGYRAKAVKFEDAFKVALESGGDIDAVEPQIFEPRNTAVGVDGNDVQLDKEVLQAAENTMLYNTYVALQRGKSRLINTAISQSP